MFRYFSTFILLLLVISLPSSAFSQSVASTSNMEKYRVVPDIIPKVPKNSIDIKYGNLNVEQGNELTPTQVHVKPSVTLNVDDDTAYHTLIMTDPDIPAIFKAKDAQHWLVVNIPGNRLQDGETLLDYVGSGAPEGSGLHRYIFLLYKQSGKIPKSHYENIKDERMESRLSHPLPGLLQQLQLDPEAVVAGNFFRAQYDENVPKFRLERLNKYKLAEKQAKV